MKRLMFCYFHNKTASSLLTCWSHHKHTLCS